MKMRRDQKQQKNMYGGTSWSCTQSKKISNKAQKIRGILNVFGGAYDHTNNQRCGGLMVTERKQFLDL